MQTEVKKTLEQYGLSENEIKVYLAVLGLGDCGVQEISLAAKIRRTTVYLVVEKLIEKGLIGQYKMKYGTRYIPSKLDTLIHRLDDLKTDVWSILPQLKAIEKKDLSVPYVRYYKGKDGYKTILNDSLDGFSYEILYMGSAKALNEIVGEKYVLEKYIPARMQRKLSFKQIVFEDAFSKKLKETDHKELRLTKFMPADSYFDANMIIYFDKVAYFSSKRELNAVLMESKDIAEMERKKFELLWKKL